MLFVPPQPTGHNYLSVPSQISAPLPYTSQGPENHNPDISQPPLPLMFANLRVEEKTDKGQVKSVSVPDAPPVPSEGKIPEPSPPGQTDKSSGRETTPVANGLEPAPTVQREPAVKADNNTDPVMEHQACDEESLEKLPMSDACTRRFQGHSYLYRNVYKSIMRNMNSYVRLNRDEVGRILMKEGYLRPAMEHAFLKLQDYNFKEHKPGGNKMAQEVIKRILSKRNIYAFILRETTHAMLQNGKVGKIGRVAEKNSQYYLKAVGIIYEESVKAVGGSEAQGTSFSL